MVLLNRTQRHRNIEGIVVAESSSERRSSSRSNVQEALLARGWVTRITDDTQAGIYSYQAPMAALFKTFKRLVTDIAAKDAFQEMIFPRHYRKAALANFGWTDNETLKYELMSVMPAHPSEGRSNYSLLGDPVQCLGFYETLRVLQEGNAGHLPERLFSEGAFKVYEDQGGWTLRNELTRRLQGGFSTGFEFAGAELVWAGRAEDTYATRWTTLHSVLGMLDSLDAQYRVVIGGSCSRDAKYPDLRGSEMPLYRIPTLDIEMYLPDQDTHSKESWIEIGGGDIAGTRLIDNFGLRSADGEALHSGCQGVGWQRIIHGFLSQKGLDEDAWPPQFTTLYRSMCLRRGEDR